MSNELFERIDMNDKNKVDNLDWGVVGKRRANTLRRRGEWVHWSPYYDGYIWDRASAKLRRLPAECKEGVPENGK